MGVAVLAMIAPTSMLGIDRGVSIAIAVGISLATAGALVAVARLGVGRLLAALPFHGHGRLAARLAAGAANLDRAFAAVLVRRARWRARRSGTWGAG